jgi:hypothetical protein
MAGSGGTLGIVLGHREAVEHDAMQEPAVGAQATTTTALPAAWAWSPARQVEAGIEPDHGQAGGPEGIERPLHDVLGRGQHVGIDAALAEEGQVAEGDAHGGQGEGQQVAEDEAHTGYCG